MKLRSPQGRRMLLRTLFIVSVFVSVCLMLSGVNTHSHLMCFLAVVAFLLANLIWFVLKKKQIDLTVDSSDVEEDQ